MPIQVKWDSATLRVVPGGKVKHQNVAILSTGNGDVIVCVTDEVVMRWEPYRIAPRELEPNSPVKPPSAANQSEGRTAPIASCLSPFICDLCVDLRLLRPLRPRKGRRGAAFGR
jgi:hypothetical protein